MSKFDKLQVQDVLRVCDDFLRKKLAPKDIEKWLKTQHSDMTHQDIRKIVQLAYEKKYVAVHPPEDIDLNRRLREKYPYRGDWIHSVHCVGATALETLDSLSQRAAELVIEFLKSRQEEDPTKKRFHVGFCAGNTTGCFSEKFATLLRLDSSLPAITLHAVSSTFSALTPLRSPISFFSHFTRVPNIDFVGLFAPATIGWKELEHVKEQVGVKEAFAERDKLDVIVTSLASSSDRHGALSRFLDAVPGGADDRKLLSKVGWMGDILLRPFSSKGPINIETKHRAITLLELEDLAKLSRDQQPKKMVVLIGGPCNELNCKAEKTDAIRALLSWSDLQVFSHLVTDTRTARRLLGESVSA